MTDDIESAESIVTSLQQKRTGIVARVAEISHERANIGFAVHADADPKARKRLDALNAEAAHIDGDLQSLDAAISEAQRRLTAAQRDEQTKEARDNAGAAG